jgi:hypothetical protein
VHWLTAGAMAGELTRRGGADLELPAAPRACSCNRRHGEPVVLGEDAAKDLGLVLSYLTGRKLSLEQVLGALEMSRSTYYDRQAKGTLTTTDTLLAAARNLALNPVDLLVRYGRITLADVVCYLATGSSAVTTRLAPLDTR